MADVGERVVITDDGVPLWTAADGDGSGFVLCHGGPGMWDYLEPVASHAKASTRVVRWDQRGCGRSGETDVYTVARFVEDLEAIRNGYGFERWIVGGHSWGASLALQYALRHPDRTRGVLYVSGTGIGLEWNPAYHREADRRRTAAEQERLTELRDRVRSEAEEREYRWLTWFPDFASRARAEELFAQIDAPFTINREANRSIVAETRSWSEADLASQCRNLHASTLIVHGADDPRPPWGIDSLAAALPNATVEVMLSVGHFPWLEAPHEFAGHLRAFLAQL